MNISLLVNQHLNNKIFDLNDKSINRDDFAYSYWLLKEDLKRKGIDISTYDINPPGESDFSISFDFPKNKKLISSKIDLKRGLTPSFFYVF